jgi:uncharacterized protein (TIGR03382 family)
MTSRGRLAAAVLAAWALTAPGTAGAFLRSTTKDSSLCLFWGARELTYSVSDKASGSQPSCPDLGTLRTLVRQSFDAWEGVSCSDMIFHEGAPSSRQDVGYDTTRPDNINLIIWRQAYCNDVVIPGDPCEQNDDCANQHNCWEFGASVAIIAVTTTTYNRATGEILDADIELNDWNGQMGAAASGNYFTCANPGPGTPECNPPGYGGSNCIWTDLVNTLTHEIGHFVGLDHSQDDPNATMAASAEPGEFKKRTLEPDDVDGLCAMYPPNSPAVTCLDNVKVVGNGFDVSGCGSSGQDGALGVLALLAGWLGARRRVV